MPCLSDLPCNKNKLAIYEKTLKPLFYLVLPNTTYVLFSVIFLKHVNKRQGNPNSQSRMDGPKTQARLGTGHKAKTKQNKNTTQKTKKMRNTDPAKTTTNKRGR